MVCTGQVHNPKTAHQPQKLPMERHVSLFEGLHPTFSNLSVYAGLHQNHFVQIMIQICILAFVSRSASKRMPPPCRVSSALRTIDCTTRAPGHHKRV